MQFGKITNPEKIDFFLPPDHPQMVTSLKGIENDLHLNVGCAKWNKQDLKRFYPKGIKDELSYYASQMNSVELNATFYKLYPKEQFVKWKNKTSTNFKFFPKLTQTISHENLLNNVAIENAKYFVENALVLEEKLGGIFLQLHESFDPSYFNRLEKFIISWPQSIPLAIELRHTDWFNDSNIAMNLYHLYRENNITNIITDTAGRRDLLHMCLTNTKTFIRFVGANHTSDYSRILQWVNRLDQWKLFGVSEINFFVHQHIEIESVKLSAYLIEHLNKKWGLNHLIPKTQVNDHKQLKLF